MLVWHIIPKQPNCMWSGVEDKFRLTKSVCDFFKWLAGCNEIQNVLFGEMFLLKWQIR